MEYWDLYNKERVKINKIVKRGDTLLEDEYHIVVNAWIQNDKGEFLICQRAINKTYPLKWECVGGSVVCGEDSQNGAIREVKEELGIDVKNGKYIGSVNRYYHNCNDILDVWLFKSNVSLDKVKIQIEEVNNVIWATTDKIKELYLNGDFEANAYFEEILSGEAL